MSATNQVENHLFIDVANEVELKTTDTNHSKKITIQSLTDTPVTLYKELNLALAER